MTESLVLRIEIGETFQQGSVKRNSQKVLQTRSYASENTVIQARGKRGCEGKNGHFHDFMLSP